MLRFAIAHAVILFGRWLIVIKLSSSSLFAFGSNLKWHWFDFQAHFAINLGFLNFFEYIRIRKLLSNVSIWLGQWFQIFHAFLLALIDMFIKFARLDCRIMRVWACILTCIISLIFVFPIWIQASVNVLICDYQGTFCFQNCLNRIWSQILCITALITCPDLIFRFIALNHGLVWSNLDLL